MTSLLEWSDMQSFQPAAFQLTNMERSAIILHVLECFHGHIYTNLYVAVIPVNSWKHLTSQSWKGVKLKLIFFSIVLSTKLHLFSVSFEIILAKFPLSCQKGVLNFWIIITKKKQCVYITIIIVYIKRKHKLFE